MIQEVKKIVDETQEVMPVATATPESIEEDLSDIGQGLDPSEEDLLEADGMDLNNMAPVNIGGIYELFSGIIKNPDVTRICNLSPGERGVLPFTVLGSLWVAQQADRFGHPIFAAFFVKQAELIEETSLSKDGFLINTIVTSKRYSNVTKDEPKNDIPITEKKKSSFKIFSRGRK